MAERSNATVLKTVVQQCIRANPFFSVIKVGNMDIKSCYVRLIFLETKRISVFRIITEIIFFKTSELMDDIKPGTL